jgi:hypothetical protein
MHSHHTSSHDGEDIQAVRRQKMKTREGLGLCLYWGSTAMVRLSRGKFRIV